MRNFKSFLKLADQFIDVAGRLTAEFKGKSAEDAKSFLKNNISALTSPGTLQNLQLVLKDKSPQEIGKILSGAHKNLSWEDALKIAHLLTDDKMDRKLPKYLQDKINQINDADSNSTTASDTAARKRMPNNRKNNKK